VLDGIDTTIVVTRGNTALAAVGIGEFTAFMFQALNQDVARAIQVPLAG